jgi:hypothetical protein
MFITPWMIFNFLENCEPYRGKSKLSEYRYLFRSFGDMDHDPLLSK